MNKEGLCGRDGSRQPKNSGGQPGEVVPAAVLACREAMMSCLPLF